MGGGRRHMIPTSVYDREERNQRGRRTDGRNLLDEWVHDKKTRDLNAEYVWNKAQFDKVDPRHTDYLLGIFGYSHLDFEVDRNKGPSGDPSLAEMTVKAIQILRKNPHGFFLMVEGEEAGRQGSGRIDHAHHHNNGRRALEEIGALDESVQSALNLTSTKDTLIVLTADHSHVFTFGGDNTPRGHPVTAGRMDHAHHYNMAARALDEVGRLDECVKTALKLLDLSNTLLVVTADHSHTLTFGGASVPRGHPVLGLDTEISDLDGKPYTTLLYGNGPGYAHTTPTGRHDLTGFNTEDINFVQQAAVPRKYETHGGEDVPVYAIGPGSHLFTGTVEQTYIAHAIAHAACIADDNSHCEKPPSDDACAAAPGPVPAPTSRRPLGQVTPTVEDHKQQSRDHRAWSAGTRAWTWTTYHALTLLMLPLMVLLR
ncbi:hypothetical protein Pmani_010929 [Petrolisthes manimaculis]|uniref:alkaline phosphatase n=2 Tax=Petrolisthes manimaculis TaxID=1843537 RepID=A0AAE1Q0K8_9EUCA|nr:hypothetical protein Pmani_010929 [Petrolisthes manimaculis]